MENYLHQHDNGNSLCTSIDIDLFNTNLLDEIKISGMVIREEEKFWCAILSFGENSMRLYGIGRQISNCHKRCIISEEDYKSYCPLIFIHSNGQFFLFPPCLMVIYFISTLARGNPSNYCGTRALL
jgi:hypothetical protein